MSKCRHRRRVLKRIKIVILLRVFRGPTNEKSIEQVPYGDVGSWSAAHAEFHEYMREYNIEPIRMPKRLRDRLDLIKLRVMTLAKVGDEFYAILPPGA